MSSPALAAALADIDTVFNGFASPTETGCEHCFDPDETAMLRTPYTRVPGDLLRRFLFKDPLHFADHAAVTRRLLPQTAHAMADGTLDGGIGRVDWRAWPAEQAAAVEAFVHAWWRDVLATPEPPYAASEVFETCATILGTVTPFLDGWPSDPVADTHFVRCADAWLYDLVSDCSPFRWWDGDVEEAGVAALRAWLSGPGAARLLALGHPHFSIRAGLLPLPYEERCAHPYWSRP
ncbi:hypothetical protein [Streptomyces resistomycificus]|uniref:hypothetical protein n=1 Tax=Streptomyces resistomycificus TaxID=67356 RepID=UPI0004AB82FC|nr:hypothetical protein [Streptomyces resistomycificus]